MPERKPAKKGPRKSAGNSKAAGKALSGFTDEERTAMRQHAQELRAAARPHRSMDTQADEIAVQEKIAAMPAPDRTMAERIHTIVKAAAPGLSSRLWYGMPAYARDGKVICFFQPAHKFKVRYGTLGFSDKAKLDEGRMWPVAFALEELTGDDETRIAALVKRAVS